MLLFGFYSNITKNVLDIFQQIYFSFFVFYYLYLYPLYPSSHQTLVCTRMLYSACHKFRNVLSEFTVSNLLHNYRAVSVSHIIVICDIDNLCSEA